MLRRLRLTTPSGARAFTVRGLLEPEGIARVYGGNLVVMDLYAAEAAFTQPGFVNGIDVVVARDAGVEQVANAIRRTLPEGLRVQPPAQRKADLHAVMQSLGVMLHAMAGIALVAGFLIVFSRLTTVFEARVWQFGVLRATGVRALALWGELLKEAFFLGAAGVALGVPLGIGVGRRAFAPLDVLAALMLLVILLGISDTLVSGVLGRTRELGVIRAVGVQRRHLGRLVVAEGLGLGTLGLILAVSAGLFAVISLATITVCLVAALIPARRAAALQPAAALRYE